MGKNSRCVIGICNNDDKHPQHYVKHSDVKGDMIMPALPKGKTKIDLGVANLNQRRTFLAIVLFVHIVSLIDNQQGVIVHQVYF